MTPEQQAIIINNTVAGVTCRDIAPQLGISHAAVNRHQHKLRDLIQKQATELLNRGLIPARRTITRLAALGNTKGADKDTLKLSLDASKVVLNCAGILSNTPGTIINNLIQVNQNEVPEQLKGLLQQIARNDQSTNKTLGNEAIDV
jgi:hypothetical protein